MASCRVGNVYRVFTTLTRPPKQKITLCIAVSEALFFWFNTEARAHGVGQFPASSADHDTLTHQCHLDLSRVTTFSQDELAGAQDCGPISRELALRIVGWLEEAPPKTLHAKHLALALEALRSMCPP